MWDSLRVILLQPAIPFWVLCVAAFVTYWRYKPQWLQQQNERDRDVAAEKAADWTRIRQEAADARKEAHEIRNILTDYIERTDKRYREQQAENDKCTRALAEAVHRIAQLEGYQLGRGEAAQDAQRFQSTKRVIDRKLKGADDADK